MSLPDPREPRDPPRLQRPVVTAAIIGGGVCLLAAIVGLVVLGWHNQGTNEVP